MIEGFSDLDLKKIESGLKQKIDDHLLSKIRTFARSSNWASDLGFACDTYHALCRLKPDLRPATTLPLKKIFRASGEWETPNLQLIQNAGIRVVEQGRSYQWPKYQISAVIDAKIQIEEIRINGKAIRLPLEHKALSPNTFRTVAKIKEEGGSLLNARYDWMKKYPAQLQIYDLLDSAPGGVWFFFEKVTGDYFFWIAPLDLEYAESLISRAARANEAVRDGVIPEPVRKDLCEECDFAATSCFVGKDFGEGYEIAIDRADLNEKARRLLELKPLHKEYEDLDEDFKAIVRGKKILTEDFLITSTEYKFMQKAKEEKEITAFRTKIKPIGPTGSPS